MYLNQNKTAALISLNVYLKEEKLTLAVRLNYNGCFFSENMLSVFYCFVLTVLASLIPDVRGKILLYPMHTNAVLLNMVGNCLLSSCLSRCFSTSNLAELKYKLVFT